ncbi:MAG: AAA domain-containing protein [Candidatus Pelethousia sp.]|nr:AAA domain-containing protein [Candidatus Pelethousia sp.]
MLDTPLEELVHAVIEETQSLASERDEDLTTVFRRVFAGRIPDLAELVSGALGWHRGFAQPSDWVLFMPQETKFSKGLVKDYGYLEAALQREPDKAYGLDLLVPGEGVLPVNHDDVQVHPFFPLNESQQAAVKSIMQNRVSVISGPPGCGKSQVVLSVLMNCWARGETVLFASNNNKAVDVVRDRLRIFQDELPVSVRTGNREVNELPQTLAKMRAHLAHGPGDGSVDNGGRIQALMLEKERYHALLETGTPQILQESLRASLGAYGKYEAACAELEECLARYRGELYALGYNCEPEKFREYLLEPLTQWLNEIKSVKATLQRNRLALVQMQERQKRLQNKRDDLLAALGGDAGCISHWEWLTEEKPLESQKEWYQELIDFLSGPLEEELRSFVWDEGYLFWEGADEARAWARSARQLLGDMNAVLTEYQPHMEEWEKLRQHCDKAKAEANQLEVYLLEEGVKEEAIQWIDAYTVYITSGARFKWLSFSERSKAIRIMRRIEPMLRRRFSVATWRQVGALDRIGRPKLCGILEAVLDWHAAQKEWETSFDDRSRAESALNELRPRLYALRVKGAPGELKAKDWADFAADLERRIIYADKAAIGHTLRRAFVSCKEKGETLCRRFYSLNRGFPLCDVWMDKNGSEWNLVLKEASESFGLENAASLRRLIYGGAMRDLLFVWEEMQGLQLSLQEVSFEIHALPADEKMIAQWWAEHPPIKRDLLIIQSELPSSEHVLFQHLQECGAWQEKWSAFTANVLPEKQNAIRLELERAKNLLQEATLRIAASDLGDSFPQSAVRLLQGQTTEWPVGDIQRWLESYGPDRIRARIRRIELRLANSLFCKIRAGKIRELAADAQVLGALAALQNPASLYAEYIKNFRTVLRVLPIWITTALSTKDIPMLPELFNLLIIDEATQCPLTNLLPLLYRAKRIAVIGDMEQLPAIDTITSGAEYALAERFGVTQWVAEYGHAGNNIYKCVVRTLPRMDMDVLFLTEHYRSHPLIIGFSNQYLYKKRLRLRRNPSQTLGVDYSGLHVLRVQGHCERDLSSSLEVFRPILAFLSVS